MLKPASWMLFALFLLTTTSPVSAQSMSAPNKGEWWNRSYEFRSKYYAVKSDLPREKSLELAQHMDVVFGTYLRMFQGFAPRKPKPLAMYLFAERQDYLDTLETRFGLNGEGSGGKSVRRNGTANMLVPVKDLDRAKKVLQHEGFHQAAAIFFHKLPVWANEGLAGVFERGIVINGKFVLGEVSVSDKQRLTNSIANREFLRFRDLFAISGKEWGEFLKNEELEAGPNYLQAWCLCHFLLYADGGKYQKNFLKFLGYLNQAVPTEKAFLTAFGVPRFEQMEKSWLAYVDGLAGTSYKQTIHRMEFLAHGLIELHEREITPVSLEQLKTELKRINFKHTSHLYGKTWHFSAEKDELFEVSMMGPKKPDPIPVFRLVDSRGRPIDPDSKSTRRPTVPPTLETYGYRPKNFRITFKRVGKTYEPNFDVD